MTNKTPILTAALMRACDDYTINTLGVPSQVLMERAAAGVVSYLEAHPDLFPVGEGRVLVLCGSGNNGGDGFAVARFLQEGIHGHPRRVSVCYGGALNPDGTPDTTKMSAECARQYAYAQKALIPVFAPSQVAHSLQHADTVIDALFGIGLDRPVTGALRALIEAVNTVPAPVLAVDIPSGIHGDTGAVMGCAVSATATVTMQALKAGLLLYPGASLCGRLHICDIGVDLSPSESGTVYLADEYLLSALLSPRDRRSHKGVYGQVSLICGSEGMCGAALLAVRGALRSGAGLVRAITTACNRAVLQGAVPEAIVTTYDPSTPLSGGLMTHLCACDGAVVGCGLGTSTGALTLLGGFLDACPIRPDFPVVLDADALNLIARHPHLWDTRLLTEGRGQVIITPHPMEMSRLTNKAVPEILLDSAECARALAVERGITVVLKDAHTVIAAPDGEIYICPYGNAGMAKGGCGDVLAGILGSVAVQYRAGLGQAVTLAELTTAGVVLHAMAGDLAADRYGEFSMTPSDLTEALADVTKAFSDTRTTVTRS